MHSPSEARQMSFNRDLSTGTDLSTGRATASTTSSGSSNTMHQKEIQIQLKQMKFMVEMLLPYKERLEELNRSIPSKTYVNSADVSSDARTIDELREIVKVLKKEKKELITENRSQRRKYERCLDKLASQMVHVLLSQKNVAGFGRRTLRLSLALSSLVGVIGRAGLRKEVGLLRPGPSGPRCFGTKWYSDVPGSRSTRDGEPASRTTADKYAMFSFAMTSGLSLRRECLQLHQRVIRLEHQNQYLMQTIHGRLGTFSILPRQLNGAKIDSSTSSLSDGDHIYETPTFYKVPPSYQDGAKKTNNTKESQTLQPRPESSENNRLDFPDRLDFPVRKMASFIQDIHSKFPVLSSQVPMPYAVRERLNRKLNLKSYCQKKYCLCRHCKSAAGKADYNDFNSSNLTDLSDKYDTGDQSGSDGDYVMLGSSVKYSEYASSGNLEISPASELLRLSDSFHEHFNISDSDGRLCIGKDFFPTLEEISDSEAVTAASQRRVVGSSSICLSDLLGRSAAVSPDSDGLDSDFQYDDSDYEMLLNDNVDRSSVGSTYDHFDWNVSDRQLPGDDGRRTEQCQQFPVCKNVFSSDHPSDKLKQATEKILNLSSSIQNKETLWIPVDRETSSGATKGFNVTRPMFDPLLVSTSRVPYCNGDQERMPNRRSSAIKGNSRNRKAILLQDDEEFESTAILKAWEEEFETREEELETREDGLDTQEEELKRPNFLKLSPSRSKPTIASPQMFTDHDRESQKCEDRDFESRGCDDGDCESQRFNNRDCEPQVCDERACDSQTMMSGTKYDEWDGGSHICEEQDCESNGSNGCGESNSIEQNGRNGQNKLGSKSSDSLSTQSTSDHQPALRDQQNGSARIQNKSAMGYKIRRKVYGIKNGLNKNNTCNSDPDHQHISTTQADEGFPDPQSSLDMVLSSDSGTVEDGKPVDDCYSSNFLPMTSNSSHLPSTNSPTRNCSSRGETLERTDGKNELN